MGEGMRADTGDLLVTVETVGSGLRMWIRMTIRATEDIPGLIGKPEA
jgi:hypothetical protein